MWSLPIAALIILSAIAIGTGVGLFIGGKYCKRPHRRHNKKVKVVTSTSEPYHSVNIICTKDSCQAALDAANTRYLSRDAPTLPIENCDAEKCRCRYKHHEDRRKNKERRFYFMSQNECIRSSGEDRRQQVDRRAYY